MSALLPPPKSPNCVSSRAAATDERHHIAPLRGTLDAVRAVLRGMPRTKLVEERAGYLRYVVTTRIFRWKDDVEFEQDGDVVHVRSAARTGWDDLGVNRRRVESIRAALERGS